MSAGSHDFLIEQGATFTEMLSWQGADGSPVDVTGWTAKMQIRPVVADNDSPTPVLELSTANGRISLGGVAGTVTLTIAASTTSGIPAPAGGHYLYDLELTSGAGVVKRLLQGQVAVSQEVTR